MLRVLFVAAECAPIVKVGGLGDVIGALPKALAKFKDIDPAVIIPFYGIIDRKRYKTELVQNKVPVSYLGKKEFCSLYRTFLPHTSIPVFLIQNKKYLSAGNPYLVSSAVGGGKLAYHRFLFFSKAVFIFLKNRIIKADIVHANDWHTGALAALLKRYLQSRIPNRRLPKIVFTVHNLGSQAGFGRRDLRAEGIINSDQVTVVSKTYAKEIQTAEHGFGLEELLQKARPIGILNGVDYGIFLKRFNKSITKRKLQKRMGLEIDDNLPLFGLVARLVGQKGLDLILPLMSGYAEKHRAQFAIEGLGDERYEKYLKALAKKYPTAVSASIAFSEELARSIYVGSDFFLMPSLFEPCGLGQMIAMRYGTIPIARATGGLKDTIKDGKTGFLFRNKEKNDLAKAVDRAIKLFHDKNKLSAMRGRCMRQDFGWERSAKEYRELYKKLI